uniref:Nuclear receptor domain-containing protein n=1 Tax=Syphacia muris TaxID=451379 RepID=A0A0N5AJS1_9BILA
MGDKTEHLCQVCEAASDGMHFGVESCRACAAFFRRTVSLKKKYVCRSGTDSCKLRNGEKNFINITDFFCPPIVCPGPITFSPLVLDFRKCRLKRCFQVGMLKDNVQPNRDPLKNCERSTQRTPINSATEHSKLLEDGQLIRCRVPTLLNDKFHSVSCSTPTECIITLIEAGYSKFCRARLDLELLRFYKTTESVQLTPNGYPKELKFCSFQELLKLHHNFKVLGAEFLRNTFECYMALPTDQKWCLFRNFFECLGPIEIHFLTKLYFPNSLNHCIATSFCTYVDLEQLPLFFGPAHNEPLAKLVGTVMKQHLELINSMRSFTVDRYELAALVALILFSKGVLKQKEYAYRLGESVSLLWLVKRCGYKYKNATETAELFGIYNVNEILYGDFGPESL